jgi:hypothetical protein
MPPKKRQKIVLTVKLCQPVDGGAKPAVDAEKLHAQRAKFEAEQKVRLPESFVALLLAHGDKPRFVRQYTPIPAEPGKYA